MLRITVDPKTLYFPNKWRIYAHLHSICMTYVNSCIKLCEIKSISDYWQVMQNLPIIELYENRVYMKGEKVTSFSIFKENITPEWEHPENLHGAEWGCRENITLDSFKSMWDELTIALVNNEFEHVVGVRCINKSNKSRVLYKIEIWMNTSKNDEIMKEKKKIDRLLKTDITFTLMYHEDKQSHAFEFVKRKFISRKINRNIS